MTTEYEDALSEMNTILEKENEDLHAKVNALEAEIEALNEKGSHLSTMEIKGRSCTVRVSAEMLVDFYQKGQPMIVRLAKEAKEAKIPTSDLVRKFDIDLRFGEREVNDQEYAKRKYCKHSYDDKAYYRDQFWRDVEKDMLERQSWRCLGAYK